MVPLNSFHSNFKFLHNELKVVSHQFLTTAEYMFQAVFTLSKCKNQISFALKMGFIPGFKRIVNAIVIIS